MDPSILYVIDGDTIKLKNHQSVRLTPYNAPEIHGKCPDEQRLAVRAKVRLTQLLNEPTAELHLVPGKTCAWGRKCGSITVNGKNVADILISEGLAEPLLCKGNKCPKRRDWCHNLSPESLKQLGR
jgi:micrococcal nuclease